METLLARPAGQEEEEEEEDRGGGGWNRNMQTYVITHTSNNRGMNKVAAQRVRFRESS